MIKEDAGKGTLPEPKADTPEAERRTFRGFRYTRVTMTLLAAAVIVIGVLLVVWLTNRGASPVVSGSGNIEAIQSDVSAKVQGRLIALIAADGDRVKKGQPIARLDRTDEALQLDQARAALALDQAKLAQAGSALALQRELSRSDVAQASAAVNAADVRVPQAGESLDLVSQSVELQIDQADAQIQGATDASNAAADQYRASQADVTAAQAQLVKTTADSRRVAALYAEGAVSAQDSDAARAALTTAQADLAAAIARRGSAFQQTKSAAAALSQARSGLTLAQAGRRTVAMRAYDVQASQAQAQGSQAALSAASSGVRLVTQRERDVDVARATVTAAKATVALAQSQLDETTIRAPFDGTIMSHAVEVGTLLSAGAPVMTVADLRDLYLRIYVGEADLANVRIGDHARISADGLGDRTYDGIVTQINESAEFTPSNVQTKDQRTELVFGVRIDVINTDGALKPGLPADADISVGSGHGVAGAAR